MGTKSIDDISDGFMKEKVYSILLKDNNQVQNLLAKIDGMKSESIAKNNKLKAMKENHDKIKTNKDKRIEELSQLLKQYQETKDKQLAIVGIEYKLIYVSGDKAMIQYGSTRVIVQEGDLINNLIVAKLEKFGITLKDNQGNKTIISLSKKF